MRTRDTATFDFNYTSVPVRVAFTPILLRNHKIPVEDFEYFVVSDLVDPFDGFYLDRREKARPAANQAWIERHHCYLVRGIEEVNM